MSDRKYAVIASIDRCEFVNQRLKLYERLERWVESFKPISDVRAFGYDIKTDQINSYFIIRKNFTAFLNFRREIRRGVVLGGIEILAPAVGFLVPQCGIVANVVSRRRDVSPGPNPKSPTVAPLPSFRRAFGAGFYESRILWVSGVRVIGEKLN